MCQRTVSEQSNVLLCHTTHWEPYETVVQKQTYIHTYQDEVETSRVDPTNIVERTPTEFEGKNVRQFYKGSSQKNRLVKPDFTQSEGYSILGLKINSSDSSPGKKGGRRKERSCTDNPRGRVRQWFIRTRKIRDVHQILRALLGGMDVPIHTWICVEMEKPIVSFRNSRKVL